MKKVGILLANGFEEIEALAPVDILRRAQISIETLSMNSTLEVVSSREIVIRADKLFDNRGDYDMIILPGGQGAWLLREDDRVIKLLKEYNAQEKYIAAICAAPMCLGKSGVANHKNVTSYPSDEVKSYLKESNYLEDNVIVDGHIITSRGPATAFDFAYKIVEILGGDVDNVKQAMLYK